jgi:hypothetical protein
MMTLVPAMVEETLVYCDILREKAKKGDMFFMDPVNLRLMLDVIGRTGLCVYQSDHSPRSIVANSSGMSNLAASEDQTRWPMLS